MTLKARIKAAIEAEIARQADAPDNLRGLYFDDACSDGFRVIDGWLDLDALVAAIAKASTPLAGALRKVRKLTAHERAIDEAPLFLAEIESVAADALTGEDCRCGDCATKDEEIKRLKDVVFNVVKAQADEEQRQAARRSREGR